MFEILFGWRKASRCKRYIRRVRCRLKLLRNKRDCIIRQLNEDVVQLIKSGHVESTFPRIEQLCKDQNVKAVYDLLDHFCEFVIINLPYIRRNRDCPNDVNEAVSSLIFASARCGDLPELQKLRKLFGERYGQRFAVVALDLLPGNLVNRKIIENLSLKSISDNVKLSLLAEIAKDSNLQLETPETDDNSELQNPQVSHRKCDLVRGEKFSEKVVELTCNDFAGAPRTEFDPLHEPEKNHDRLSGQSNTRTCSSSQLSSASFELKSESPSRLSERSIVYLDDVEEFEPSVEQNVNDKDRRVFTFKSTIPCMKDDSAATATSLSVSYHDQVGSSEDSDGKTSSRGSTKRRKVVKKKLKRTSVLPCKSPKRTSVLPCKSPIATVNFKDVECAIYYGESGDSSPNDENYSRRSHHQRKHQQDVLVDEFLPTSSGDHPKKLAVPKSPHYASNVPRRRTMGSSRVSHNCKVSQRRTCSSANFKHDIASACCFEHPCHFILADNRRCPSPIKRSEIKAVLELSHPNIREECECTCDEESLSTTPNGQHRAAVEKATSYSMEYHQRLGSASLPQKPMIEDYTKGILHVFKPSPIYKVDEQGKDIEEAEIIDCRISCASSHDSCSRVTSPWRQARPPYMRAMTMPPERLKDKPTYQMPRSISSLSQQPDHSTKSSSASSSYSHVHPKLPNYDDLSAQFRALKKEQL